MKIWVDGDACPAVIRDILFRATIRTETPLVFVSNRVIQLPVSSLISRLVVSAGLDAADHAIVQQVQQNDLVITSDIPLADEIIQKQATALSPRGELFTCENIKSRLNVRDFMETMRASGFQTRGPDALQMRDRQAFAAHLDRILSKKK